MDKRGLSTVVATLLIILLSLVIIGIFWAVVRGVIGSESEESQDISKFFGEQAIITDVDVDFSDPLMGSVAIKKLTGKTTGTETVTRSFVDIDLISVVDLSGSMYFCPGTLTPRLRECQCRVVNSSCSSATLCSNVLGSGANYSSVNQSCYNVSSDPTNKCTNRCGGRWDYGAEAEIDANKFLVGNISTFLGDARIGLVAYNTSFLPSHSLFLTQNLQALNNTINLWSTGNILGDTCICCGIRNATNWLNSSTSGNEKKIMIVMSDGGANVYCNGTSVSGFEAVPETIQAACNASSTLSNLTIHSIGFKLVVSKHEETLINISKCGNGTYFDTNNQDQLIKAYEQIADSVVTKYTSTHKFNFLRIFFYDREDHSFYIDEEIPDVLETLTYDFNLTGKGLTPPIARIEVYPVIIQASGQELLGPRLDYWIY